MAVLSDCRRSHCAPNPSRNVPLRQDGPMSACSRDYLHRMDSLVGVFPPSVSVCGGGVDYGTLRIYGFEKILCWPAYGSRAKPRTMYCPSIVARCSTDSVSDAYVISGPSISDPCPVPRISSALLVLAFQMWRSYDGRDTPVFPESRRRRLVNHAVRLR